MEVSMWLPVLTDDHPTISGRLLSSLRRDIASGALPPGTRLPTHRDLSHRLGIGLGTVTGVYAEAVRLGLIEARVGRGSFVCAALASATGPIALSPNVPPPEPARRRFAAAVARLRWRTGRPDEAR